MFGLFRTDSRASRGRVASALAIGAALAAGATVLVPTEAVAQRQQRQSAPQQTFSAEFSKVYQPVAEIANAEAGDFAAAKAQLPAVIAAVQTPDDRFAAGNVTVVLGSKLNDRALQRQGIELMLASGKAAPEQIGQMQSILGGLAYDAKDFSAALTAFNAAKAAGYHDDNIDGLMAESYFQSGQAAQGLDFLEKAAADLKAAGKPVPAAWARRGLRAAYEGQLQDRVGTWSAMLIELEPTPANWAATLQITRRVSPQDQQFQLDTLRLMRMANALTERDAYVAYIEAADPRIMSNEVAKVLDAAVAASALTTTDQYYTDVKRVVDQRAAEDRREAASLVAEARQSGAGSDALNAGDVLYSLDQFAEAEEMFRLAAEKGTDRDKALTRLGIAQVQQGKLADAKATFGQVQGNRAALARMWQAYIDTKA